MFELVLPKMFTTITYIDNKCKNLLCINDIEDEFAKVVEGVLKK
ncbi:hypothetical protein FACS189468_1240 [Spirochaetia bacterium]|nr:hypothetical protein FACS189468_1240 [Spirochaetia bacterium]